MDSRWRRWLSTLSAPRRAVPALLSFALIGALLGLADVPRVAHLWRALSPLVGVLVLGLATLYLGLKVWQFSRLLMAAGLDTDWRGEMAAFAVGEMTLMLPLGNYAQNYVLSKLRGQDFARSAATTTMAHVLEVVFLAAVLAGLPVGSWPQMRLILWCGIGLCILLGVLLAVFHPLRRAARSLGQHKNILGKIARKAVGFLKEMRALAKWRVFLTNLLITAAYLLALMAAYYAVAQDLGQGHLSYLQAVTIYAFGLLVAMLFGGLLSQVGTVELAGATAAQAMGIDLHNTVATLIWFRMLWTVSIWLVSGTVLLVLHRQFTRLSAQGE